MFLLYCSSFGCKLSLLSGEKIGFKGLLSSTQYVTSFDVWEFNLNSDLTLGFKVKSGLTILITQSVKRVKRCEYVSWLGVNSLGVDVCLHKRGMFRVFSWWLVFCKEIMHYDNINVPDKPGIHDVVLSATWHEKRRLSGAPVQAGGWHHFYLFSIRLNEWMNYW